MERKLGKTPKPLGPVAQEELDRYDDLKAEKSKSGNGCQKPQPYCPLEALHDVVILTKYKGPTEGGLHLPDNADVTQPGEKLTTLKGIVVAAGPGRYPDDYLEINQVFYSSDPEVGPIAGKVVARFPMSVRPGDIVYFPDMVGTDVVIGGVTYYMIHEGDILARVKSESK